MFFDVKEGIETKSLKAHAGTVNALAVSNDGTMLVSGGANKVKLWNVETKSEIKTFTGHSAQISSVAFSPDGKKLASSSLDGTIIIRDLSDKTDPKMLKGDSNKVNSIAFSPDGKTLASGGFGVVRLWDAESGIEIKKLENLLYSVDSVSFHGTEKYFCSTPFKKLYCGILKPTQKLKTLFGTYRLVNFNGFRA